MRVTREQLEAQWEELSRLVHYREELRRRHEEADRAVQTAMRELSILIDEFEPASTFEPVEK